jgi:hypothetical protein
VTSYSKMFDTGFHLQIRGRNTTLHVNLSSCQVRCEEWVVPCNIRNVLSDGIGHKRSTPTALKTRCISHHAMCIRMSLSCLLIMEQIQKPRTTIHEHTPLLLASEEGHCIIYLIISLFVLPFLCARTLLQKYKDNSYWV